MVSSDLATYNLPLAIAILLLYQQSSSTISPYSYALPSFIAPKGGMLSFIYIVIS